MTACGSNQHGSPDTGSISYKLQLPRPMTASRAAAATSADICTDYGIMFINANVMVTSSGEEVAAGSWPCASHEGEMEGVPAGGDYTIRITGTAIGGITEWSGEQGGVIVTAGETTLTGPITMTYTGSDITAPVITSTVPSGGGTGVPVTSIITAVFSERIAATSVNDTTFTLREGATQVSGSVSYDAGNLRAEFRPSTNLSYSTEYSATLTTDIEDMAGNNMELTYSWSFTTGDLTSGLPDAPEGLMAASGHGQVTMTWDAVPAATSYNIYWSETSGVSKAAEEKISGITNNSYTHTGLTNGKTYYYVATSVNSEGESNESSEISSAPGSIDGALPTGSITINNDAVSTASAEVTLSLSSSSTKGISQMCISNTSTCSSSSWEPYTTSKLWTLTAGDGTKFVYAWFKDSSGAINADPYFSSITLDTISIF